MITEKIQLTRTAEIPAIRNRDPLLTPVGVIAALVTSLFLGTLTGFILGIPDSPAQATPGNVDDVPTMTVSFPPRTTATKSEKPTLTRRPRVSNTPIRVVITKTRRPSIKPTPTLTPSSSSVSPTLMTETPTSSTSTETVTTTS